VTLRSGWTRGPLADVIDSIQAGHSASGEARQIGPSEVGVLTTSAVLSGVFDPSQHKAVAPHDRPRLKAPVTAQTIVFCRKNSEEVIGGSAFVEEDAPNLFLSDLLWSITAKGDADPRWLAYVLQHPDVRARIRTVATGTQVTMKNISRDRLLGIEIAIPPLAEQRKIADILRTWDQAIETLGNLRKELLQLRKWLRNNILTGRVRVPGFSEDWITGPLSDVLHEHGATSTGKEEVYSVSVHKGLVNQIEHLGRSYAGKNTDSYGVVRPGDIVYTKSPTGDFPLGIVKQSNVDADVIVSPLYAVFSPETVALGSLLDAYFESPTTTGNYLQPLVQKGAKNTIAITNRRFLEGRLSLPRNEAEQRAIASILKSSAEEIRGLSLQIESLRLQKRGLMQNLMNGNVSDEREKRNGHA